jgi:hypothetical protein
MVKEVWWLGTAMQQLLLATTTPATEKTAMMIMAIMVSAVDLAVWCPLQV